MCSLKAKAIKRLCDDMFKIVIEQANSQQIILILDDYSAKIVSSYMTMSQILNLGFFSVELLSKQRKPFRRFHSCYFLSPSQESCDLVIKDYDNSIKPQYSRVHLFFTHNITDDLIENYATENLIRRIMTCQEVNLSFQINDHNLFHFGFENNINLFSLPKEEQYDTLSIITERLFTVCSLLQEFPSIIYQTNSSICQKVAMMLQEKLSMIFKGKEKQGILLIVDRTIDPTTPFLHDYSWETLIYDIFPVEGNTISFDNKSSTLDDNDEIWMKYKNCHMAKVFDQLPVDFDEFLKSDLTKKSKKVSDMESFEQMAEAMKNMPEYKLKTDMFSLHLRLAEEVTNQYNKLNLFNLIEFEQDIISGVQHQGDPIIYSEIIKTYGSQIRKLTKENNLRLLGELMSSFELTQGDLEDLIKETKDLIDNNDSKLFSNLQYIGIKSNKGSASNNPKRREIYTQSKEKIKEIKSRMKKKIDYNNTRVEPKLSSIVEQCSQGELPKREFAYIDSVIPKQPKKLHKRRLEVNMGNKIHLSHDEDDDENLPNLITFVIGGIAHNEISAIQRLGEEDKVYHKIILGSTGIYNAKQYIDQITQANQSIEINKDNDSTHDLNDQEVKISLSKDES